MLADSDTLIVTELSRLGRSTAEVIALVNELVARTIRVIIPMQKMNISWVSDNPGMWAFHFFSFPMQEVWSGKEISIGSRPVISLDR